MGIEDHYSALVNRSGDLLRTMAADSDALSALTKSHNFLVDYEVLRLAIADRPESTVFASAIREYEFALYAVSVGTYRHAFISLRLFLELALATVYFSASEIKYRKWVRNSEDIVWGALVDKEGGV
jgi:hypothetical protein